MIRSNVAGDRVAIDARPVGGSGPTRHAVSVGEHRILVQKEGYVTWEGVTRVKPAQLVTLRAQLFEAAQTEPVTAVLILIFGAQYFRRTELIFADVA